MSVSHITKVGLGIAQRDSRATAGEFARAIMQRYEGWHEYLPRLGTVFRQVPPSVAVRPVYHYTQVHLAPHVALTSLTAAGPSLPRPKLERVIETFLFQQPVTRLRREQIRMETIVRQLVAREVRIDSVVDRGRVTVSTNADSPAMPRVTLPARQAVLRRQAPPVPRVVRRTSFMPAPDASTTDFMEPPRSTHAEAKRWPAWPLADEPPSNAVLSAVELNRLTDHVVQAIDRRITAHRERLGRA